MPDEYEIETKISRKREAGIMKYIVKWLGYLTTFNSWVSAADIREI